MYSVSSSNVSILMLTDDGTVLNIWKSEFPVIMKITKRHCAEPTKTRRFKRL